MTPDMPNDVAAVLSNMPVALQPSIIKLRAIIFDVAHEAEIGGLNETLKWGEISYLPAKKRVGTTIRLGAEEPDVVRFFVPCQTRLLDIYRARFPEEFTYVGDREVRMSPEQVDQPHVGELVALALTYHSEKRGASA